MKRFLAPVLSAVLSVAFVVTAALLVRHIGADAYQAYCERGGSKGFWSWFARDACGLPLSSMQEEKNEPSVAHKREAQATKERQQKLAKEEGRLIRLLSKKKAELAAADKKQRERQAKDAKKNRSAATEKKRRSKGSSVVMTGGKSSHIAADGKTPYRVMGIRGIEFGASDNAPAEGVKPILSVAYDADGNAEFRGIKWRENKALTEPVYGFDKAYLNHTYDTEQLSSVTFNKSFPFTEEGMKQAMDFYKSMSAEASADLGFDIVDVDRTGNLKSATVCEFRNGDGDTSIRGAINAWNDKSLTVTFSVSDKAYSKELTAQSKVAYQAGAVDAANARVEVVGKDHTDQKLRILDYLGD